MIQGDLSLWAGTFPPSLIEEVLAVLVSCWPNLLPLSPVTKEDPITNRLVAAMRAEKRIRRSMFRIDPQYQVMELETGEVEGRIDICVSAGFDEEVFFALECKRLNVQGADGKIDVQASKYVQGGMVRFVTGPYARAQRHGGMVGYVMDGDVQHAMAVVEKAIGDHRVALCIPTPDSWGPSPYCEIHPESKESLHQPNGRDLRLHHLFLRVPAPSAHACLGSPDPE
ncbi:hypothetical protein L6R50_09050 [Myxococcota bacterium]|nr:hypothetical protein [Myxococcota bacterium]